MAALSDRNILEDLKFLQSGSWHFWYHTSSFRSTTILQRVTEPNQKAEEHPQHSSEDEGNKLHSHDVVAFVKPPHVFTPAVFGDVINKKLLCGEVVPSS